MTYWDELEVKARALFEKTAAAMGWSKHVEWDYLHEDTKDNYRREAVKRLPVNGNARDGD